MDCLLPKGKEMSFLSFRLKREYLGMTNEFLEQLLGLRRNKEQHSCCVFFYDERGVLQASRLDETISIPPDNMERPDGLLEAVLTIACPEQEAP